MRGDDPLLATGVRKSCAAAAQAQSRFRHSDVAIWRSRWFFQNSGESERHL